MQSPESSVNTSVNTPAMVPIEPFLHKVGKPIIWMAVGYLLATLIQRPTRQPRAI